MFACDGWHDKNRQRDLNPQRKQKIKITRREQNQVPSKIVMRNKRKNSIKMIFSQSLGMILFVCCLRETGAGLGCRLSSKDALKRHGQHSWCNMICRENQNRFQARSIQYCRRKCDFRSMHPEMQGSSQSWGLKIEIRCDWTAREAWKKSTTKRHGKKNGKAIQIADVIC